MSTSSPSPAQLPAQDLDIALERDVFLRTLIRELSGTLQDVVGLDEASGFVSVVGQRIGEWIDHNYREAWQIERMTAEQVAEVLVDLKARINGQFRLEESTPEKMTFFNTRCPFEEKVIGRPSMCMMTSNVFGTIAAENLGYAKVELQKTIANGDGCCRVAVHLRPTTEALACTGREYFGDDEIV
ncbi:transcriptional regulator [Halothiobacillus diazotrophicus]|uniref:Transcriptional regulator n=1 Tax=Halothiobacillus diazotrophicus TaxID=1860122 RepID=A0A191ZHH8_9GAMM|nr:methanogen output domain 1-containing protein [Halothiobacillus diazotrophicus]ANJ67320.1 transcriptional regulator [Halothiobacillus diazotrophicus]